MTSPLAEVDNCSRVIKYVVTLGYRYGSETLMDMRIHDINVVADLDSHDPTSPDPEAPVESDGTCYGKATGALESSTAASLEETPQYLQGEWSLDNFWPLFVLSVLSPVTLLVLLQVAIDLLAQLTITSLAVVDLVMDAVGGGDGWVVTIDELFKDGILWWQVGDMLKIALACWRIADGLRCSGIGNLGLLAAILAATMATLAALVVAQSYVVILTEMFGQDSAWVAGFYAVLLVTYLRIVIKYDVGDTIESKFMSYGTRFMTRLLSLAGQAIPADWNPVTGSLTMISTALTIVYFVVQWCIHMF